MVCKKIDVSPSFVAFLFVYYYFDPMQTFLPFLFSVALHEMGHLLMLRFCKIDIQTIRLRAFGAQIVTEPLGYREEFAVAAAGPAFNFLLLILCSKKMPMVALVNLCLLAYNLLPIFPLDGGRMIRALLSMLLPERTVHILEQLIKISCLGILVCLCCYLTCVWHAGLWPIIVAAMLIMRVAETISPEKIKNRV